MGTTEVIVGVVGRAHGVRGDVVLDVRTDEPDRRFAAGNVLVSEDRQASYEVAVARWHGDTLLVRFVGFDDRTAAEGLRGVVLVTDVDTDERPGDVEEYYDRHLIGLRVRDHEGRDRGVVTQVQHGDFQDLLVVDVGPEVRLVPFTPALVPVVDLPGGFVQIAPVGGLLSEE